MIFLQNFIFILGNLILFTLCGWSVIAPFARRIAFPTACAALCGMILLSCAALAVHVVLAMTYWKAAVAAGGPFVFTGGLFLFSSGPPKAPLKPACFYRFSSLVVPSTPV